MYKIHIHTYIHIDTVYQEIFERLNFRKHPSKYNFEKIFPKTS